MKNVKVSILVCVYNGEELLERCLDSIFTQTLQEKEIVIVNDGSTDRTGEIISRYQKRYGDALRERLIIINQTNKGTCLARKACIEASGGEYLAFVDADDYVRDDAFEILYKCAEENEADIVQFRAEKYKIPDSIKPFYNQERTLLMSDIMGTLLTGGCSPLPLWFRIYKRNLFKNVRYPDMYEILEDWYITPQLLLGASNISFLNLNLYYYNRFNKNSASRYVSDLITPGLCKQKIIANISHRLHAWLMVKKHLQSRGRYLRYRKYFKAYEKYIIINLCKTSFTSSEYRLGIKVLLSYYTENLSALKKHYLLC